MSAARIRRRRHACHYSLVGREGGSDFNTNFTKPHELMARSRILKLVIFELVSLLLRRERVDDFFEARLAAQRIQNGISFNSP